MRGYVAWMFVATLCVIFVVVVREGPIHQAAWSDACETLRTGGAIEGHWNTINHCKDFDPRRIR